jgi:hypothetical protein
LLSELERETSGVVTFGQSLEIMHAAHGVWDIDPGKGINFTGISSAAQELWILQGSRIKPRLKNGIVYSSPIARLYQFSGIFFGSFGPCKASWLAGNTKEGF